MIFRLSGHQRTDSSCTIIEFSTSPTLSPRTNRCCRSDDMTGISNDSVDSTYWLHALEGVKSTFNSPNFSVNFSWDLCLLSGRLVFELSHWVSTWCMQYKFSKIHPSKHDAEIILFSMFEKCKLLSFRKHNVSLPHFRKSWKMTKFEWKIHSSRTLHCTQIHMLGGEEALNLCEIRRKTSRKHTECDSLLCDKHIPQFYNNSSQPRVSVVFLSKLLWLSSGCCCCCFCVVGKFSNFSRDVSVWRTSFFPPKIHLSLPPFTLHAAARSFNSLAIVVRRRSVFASVNGDDLISLGGKKKKNSSYRTLATVYRVVVQMLCLKKT